MAGRVITSIVSVAFVVIGIGFYLASMLTDYWVGVPNYTYGGLFKFCVPLTGECRDIGWDPSQPGILWVFVTRILMLVGAAVFVTGLLNHSIGMGMKQFCPVLAGGILYIIGGLLIFAGCGVFTSGFSFYLSMQVSPGSLSVIFSYQYSFYFGWVSGCMFILAGIVAIVGCKSATWFDRTNA